MSYGKLEAAGRAWESSLLNDHLRDWDVSEARDRAIEARTAELLERRGPKGYHPLDENVRLAFHETYTAGEVLDIILPHLEAGDYQGVGRSIAVWLRVIAEKEAAAEAAIQIDKEWNEASGSELDAYDDRERDR